MSALSRNAGWLLAFCLPLAAVAARLEVTVKDPSGAAVPGARVEVSTSQNIRTAEATTGTAGLAVFELAAAAYTVKVEHAGFDSAERFVDVTSAATAKLEITLVISRQETAIEVADQRSSLANSDPNYQAMRTGALKTAYTVTNLTLTRDIGTILLKSGTVSFLPPVLGRVVLAVFTGEGEFRLKPRNLLDGNQLHASTGKTEIIESIKSAVFCFTDGTYAEITGASKQLDEPPPGAGALKEFHSRARHRSDTPRSQLEAILGGENVINVEAELLADLYDQSSPKSFVAFLHGAKHGDLRFFLKPRGAMPQLPSPEEVALINVDVMGEDEGIWYLSHTLPEWESGQVTSMENNRTFTVEHYKIDTAIGKRDRLSAVAELRIRALVAGPRLLRFSLLPALRVTRVMSSGKELPYVQEGRKEDGSFYVILPAPVAAGSLTNLSIEYTGDKVVNDAGGGTFYVHARSSWYPSANAFTDRSTFDLTFKVPKKYKLIGVGKLVKEWVEDDYAASHWVSEIPLAVAGFNYGQFKRKSVTDDSIHYDIETYASEDVPGYLKQFTEHMVLTPSALAENALIETQNSLRVFQKYFGDLPYGRIAITQQPDFFFGQSWPTLVYLPVSAFLDATQRWALLGRSSFKFASFIEEVTPHEVAHQWWGHVVGWASYHDEWLSEGFADFSAGLYLQLTEPKPDKFLKYWERARDRIVKKNEFGVSPNDAGPVWMGFRLDTFKNPRAYNDVVYPKGGYILHMLRQLMYDSKDGDAQFIAMMHEFVRTSFNKTAATETFKQVVDKYVTRNTDLDGNHRLDWFFSQWVFGTEIPSYRCEYSLTPQSDGKVQLSGTLTQEGVSDNFKMRVPLYIDIDGRLIRAGSLYAIGSKTMPKFEIMLPKKPRRVLINAMHDVLVVHAVSKEIS